MKVLLTPDLHISDKNIENRTDDISKTSLRKLRFIFETAVEHKCSIYQPGDMWDIPNPSYRFFKRVVSLLNEYKNIDFFTIFGQHDMLYRTRDNTALKALSASCSNLHLEWDGGVIKTCSFGKEIPESPTDVNFSILLIHKMIIKKKVWEGQEEYEYAKTLLSQANFDLIISGDNHSQFYEQIGNRFLFNCGTLIRDTSDLIDYKPYLVLFDTKICEWEKIYVPIEPSEKVFKLDKIKREKERDVEIEKFVDGIKTYRKMGLDFKQNIFTHLKDNEVSNSVKSVFEKAFIRIGDSNEKGRNKRISRD